MSSISTTKSEDLPAFDDNLKSQIQRLLRKQLGQKFVLSTNDWNNLHHHLLDYKKENEYWEGFMNQRQIGIFTSVQKKASKLLADLENVHKLGLDWGLDFGSSQHSVEGFITQLEALASMTPKSPRSGESKRKDDGWASHQEELRGILQTSLDVWWKRITNTNPVVEDEHDSPFGVFLEHVYSALPPETDLGHSRTAVRKRRGDARRNSERLSKMHSTILDALK